MEHKIINIGDYLLIVDDSEIKEASIILANDYSGIAKVVAFKAGHMLSISIPHNIELGTMYHQLSDWKKVIAHLPLNNSPILEGVPLLPPLEDEVEKLAKEEIERYRLSSSSIDKPREVQRFNGFKTGYNKAKEKYKYTEEDLIEILKLYSNHIQINFNPAATIQEPEEFIQSLQQPKMPVGFKRKESGSVISGGLRTGHESQPPGLQTHTSYETIINPQGLTQWIGEWIY